jgi:hypothetical protein
VPDDEREEILFHQPDSEMDSVDRAGHITDAYADAIYIGNHQRSQN